MWRTVDVAAEAAAAPQLLVEDQGFLEHEMSRLYGVQAIPFFLASHGRVCVFWYGYCSWLVPLLYLPVAVVLFLKLLCFMNYFAIVS
jgi:hypothetical protein